MAVRYGFGKHDESIPYENRLPLRKLEYTFSVLYNPILVTTKASILAFYLTLAKNTKVFQYCCWGTMAIVVGAGLALTVANIFQCTPVWAEFANPVSAYAYCADIITLYLSSAPVNITTDLAILALPIPILTRLRLPKKQKIVLIITFSFGAFVAAVDVVRIAYLEQAFQVRFVGEYGSRRVSITDDFSWSASLSFMWSAIEVHVGIICACVPSLKPLVAKILPSMLRDTSNPHDVSAPAGRSLGLASRPDGRKAVGLNIGHSRQPDMYSMNSPGLPSNARQQRSRALQSGSDANDPASEEIQQSTADNEMDFMEFLTTPEMAANDLNKASTNMTTNTNRSTATNFDFYNMASNRPMTKLTNRESILPLVYVTILFFLWGCAYGFLNVLNSRFSAIANLTEAQSVGTHAAYYGGYLIGPFLPGRWILKHGGFKATFITGLCIYAVGTLAFWPAAVVLSFPAFIISNLIVGIGVSVLEVAANPFIALCGPIAYAEARLNISQGFQAIGTVLAPLLAQRVLFRTITNAVALIDVQWTYLGIALFAIALAVVFFYLPIPEASDQDFEEVAERRESVNSAMLFGRIKVVYVTLALGVLAQFCYVSAQEAVSVNYGRYIEAIDVGDRLDAFDWQTVGHTVFALGRFLCAALQFFIKPRRILLLLYVGMITTAALCMVLTGRSGIAVLTLFELFQSGVFSFIFAISLRGLGSHTKTGAVWLTVAIFGGAVGPFTQNPIISGYNVSYSFCIVVATTCLGAIFPIYLETIASAKKQVDPIYPKTPVLPAQLTEKSTESHDKPASDMIHRLRSRFKKTRDVTSREHIAG